MNFEKHVESLINMCSIPRFESEKNDFLHDYKDLNIPYATIEDSNLGVVKTSEKNPETGEYYEFNYSFDEHILDRTKGYLINPFANILNSLNKKEFNKQLDVWISDLSSAYAMANSNNGFYKNFPKYLKSIVITKEFLLSAKSISIEKQKIPITNSNKKISKVYELESDLQVIIQSGDHIEAVDNLKKNYKDFEWGKEGEEVNREFFYKTTKGVNKSQISKALEKIAISRWRDEYPMADTIKKHLLDNRKFEIE